MGVSVATTRVAVRTSNGTQDITIAGFGTPKAALFIYSWGVTDGTPAVNAYYSIGMTDGTEQFGIGLYHQTAQASANTLRVGLDDECYTTTTEGNQASFNSWITDGIRLDVTSSGTAALLTVVLFGGTDLSVDVHSVAPTTGGADVTAPGFRPDLLIVIGNGLALPTTSANDSVISVGFATYNGGSPVNVSGILNSQDAVATSAVWGLVRNDACTGQVFDGSETWMASAGTFDANGYTMTSNNDPAGDEVAVLALNFGGAVDCWAGIMDTPTSTGNDAQTGPGFTPQFVGLVQTLLTAVNTVDSTSAGTFGTGAFDDTREYCHTISDEDGQATTDTQTLADDQAVNVPADSGAALFAGTFSSFDANGWTINFSATDGTANKWPAMAIGAEAAAGGVVVLRRRRECA